MDFMEEEYKYIFINYNFGYLDGFTLDSFKIYLVFVSKCTSLQMRHSYFLIFSYISIINNTFEALSVRMVPAGGHGF